MILTHDVVLSEVERGKIRIEPFDIRHLGAASYDMRLGQEFRRFRHINGVYTVTNDANFEDLTTLESVSKGDTFLVKPGETVLGITQERLYLDSSLAAWIEGRSRMARIGLGVHISSGFVQPGVENHQVLEITNLGPTPLALIPGIRICQLVFQRCEGEARYVGQYAKQTQP